MRISPWPSETGTSLRAVMHHPRIRVSSRPPVHIPQPWEGSVGKHCRNSRFPTRSRPSSDSAQVPHWLHRAIMSLYILLALFCIILLACVLVKNSEMSQELLVLKKELSNVSNSTQECQEEQKQGWNNVNKSISETKRLIDTVKNNVQIYHKKLETLPADIGQIKTQLDKISEKLQNLQTPKPAAP